MTRPAGPASRPTGGREAGRAAGRAAERAPGRATVAARLLAGQLRVRACRVALVPGALLAVAVPVLAGLALSRRDAPAEADATDPGSVPATR